MRNRWLVGARPRTLPAAVVPVAVGTAAAAPHAVAWRAALALVVSVALQVGVNYANDYSDGVRGTDSERVGPRRLVASGAASPEAVRAAALGCFVVAAAAGIPLAAVAGWWLIGLGAAAMLAAWGYTGGPRPYGYRGLGELFVFVFFGLVAVVGTAFVQTRSANWLDFAAALPVGSAAMAMLMANNLRDIGGDEAAGKRTLAVRLGERRSRALFGACLAGSAATVVLVALWRPPALIALVALPAAIRPLRLVASGATGAALRPALGQTALFQMLLGALLAAGLWVGA